MVSCIAVWHGGDGILFLGEAIGEAITLLNRFIVVDSQRLLLIPLTSKLINHDPNRGVYQGYFHNGGWYCC